MAKADFFMSFFFLVSPSIIKQTSTETEYTYRCARYYFFLSSSFPTLNSSFPTKSEAIVGTNITTGKARGRRRRNGPLHASQQINSFAGRAGALLVEYR